MRRTCALVRFGLVGGATTALTYLIFVGLIGLHVHYLIASAAGWAASVCVSYVLNKRFTFSDRTGASLGEVGKFVGGYVLQFLVASTGYAILIGGCGLKPTPAFLVNLVITSAVSFTYMRLIVFQSSARRATLPV